MMFNFYNKKWRKKILFISSPITTKLEDAETLDYFAYIVSILSQKIENAFPNYDLVVKVPEDEGDPSDKQAKIIKEAIKTITNNKDEYDAVIVSPYDKNKEIDEVIELCKTCKVLLIDQGYYTKDEKAKFKASKVDRPPFVQSNWDQGGRIAAKSIIYYLNGKSINSPNILIIKGNVGSDERIVGFKKELNESRLKPKYWNEIDGKYSKQKASEVFLDFLDKIYKRKERIDVIFCTNDAMALGVKEVLTSKSKLGLFTAEDAPAIIGYDGIRDFTLPMSIGDPFLFDTVDVQLLGQMSCFLDMLKVSINGIGYMGDKYHFHPNISYKSKII
ncbi:MAG: substrate-binding domain-containing protein [Bacteroidetes bacterium]|nr:substrate-binding domain-containing protein [Bacteroidota bacterium]